MDAAPLRAGDTVLHHPSGERWTLACDEDKGYVVCAGWPETIAARSDVAREKAATDEERLEMLRQVAESCADQFRGRMARLQSGAP